MRHRKERVLRYIDQTGKGIEVGPSHQPIAPKKEGFKVDIIDYLSRDQLVAKFKDHHVNLDNIEAKIYPKEHYLTFGIKEGRKYI